MTMTVPQIKRKRGGQKGNQNARKHGFYSHALNPAQKHDLKKAIDVRGVDEEIAILRVKLKSILSSDTTDLRLISLVTASLVRLLRFKYLHTDTGLDDINRIMGNFITQYALPLGPDIIRSISELDTTTPIRSGEK